MRSCANCRPYWRPGPACAPSAAPGSTPTREPRPNEVLLGAFRPEGVVPEEELHPVLLDHRRQPLSGGDGLEVVPPGGAGREQQEHRGRLPDSLRKPWIPP